MLRLSSCAEQTTANWLPRSHLYPFAEWLWTKTPSRKRRDQATRDEKISQRTKCPCGSDRGNTQLHGVAASPILPRLCKTRTKHNLCPRCASDDQTEVFQDQCAAVEVRESDGHKDATAKTRQTVQSKGDYEQGGRSCAVENHNWTRGWKRRREHWKQVAKCGAP